jgi:hypothetical protein
VCGKDPSELDEPCEECGLDYIPIEETESTEIEGELVYDEETHRISEGYLKLEEEENEYN